MNFTAHKRVADLACRIAHIEGKYRDDVFRFSTFPDEVDDVYVKGVGTSILKHKFCSAAHFIVPMDEKLPPSKTRFRGYCMARDESLPRLYLPHRDVSCQYQKWNPLGFSFTPPLYELIETLRDTGSCLAADEMTFNSGAVLAEYLAYSKLASCFGAAIHLVTDACVPHHARGWLGKGHVEWEDKQDAWLQKQPDDLILSALPKIPVNACDSNSTVVRRVTERCAYLTSRIGWKPDEKLFLQQTRLAVAASAAVLGRLA